MANIHRHERGRKHSRGHWTWAWMWVLVSVVVSMRVSRDYMYIQNVDEVGWFLSIPLALAGPCSIQTISLITSHHRSQSIVPVAI